MEVVKMKQGMSYSRKEKIIILNVYKYFRTIHPDLCITEIVRRTSKATGCSEKSVFQFRKEETSAEGFKQPSKTKIRTKININSRTVKYDDNIRQAIRNIVYDLKCRHIIPSLSRILKIVRSDDKLPSFSLMTLRRLLFDMGFCYERDNPDSKAVLVEKQVDINSKKVDKLSNKKNLKKSYKTNSGIHVRENVPDLVSNPNNSIQNEGHVQQHNPLYMSNRNHQFLPLSFPQHGSTHNDLEMPQEITMHSRPHQLHQLPHTLHLKHSYNFMHFGMAPSENVSIHH